MGAAQGGGAAAAAEVQETAAPGPFHSRFFSVHLTQRRKSAFVTYDNEASMCVCVPHCLTRSMALALALALAVAFDLAVYLLWINFIYLFVCVCMRVCVCVCACVCTEVFHHDPH